MGESGISLDVLIFGGGVAGVWLLDELRRRGYAAALVENRALGHGQTVASQGIIHGGLKYMFDGNLTAPAKAISEMPVVWREAIAGRREPDLSGTKIRSECCYIWGTGSIKSRIFLKGSSIALRAAPEPVERADWPAALADVPGKVMKVAEQVIDPGSMIERFVERNRGALIWADAAKGPEFNRDAGGRVVEVRIHPAGGAKSIVFAPRSLVLSAGEGNGALRESLGLSPQAMQRRPLHMVMARGELPALFGHCVGGPKPRVTVTTAVDSAGRNVWQVGGQIAEEGVKLDAPDLIRHAKAELAACVPGVDLSGVEFATYRIDRAEAATTTGQRPDDVHLVQESNVITAFPTKLALAPRLAERVLEMLPEWGEGMTRNFGDVPTPPVARPPWETETRWVS